MGNLLSPILRPIGLDPSEQYDTAAAGAKQAQQQANALSELQWQRQMQGLQGAMGFVNNLQALYNQIYSPGGGQPAAGGAPLQGPSQSAMQSLASPAPPAQKPRLPEIPGTGWRSAANSAMNAQNGYTPQAPTPPPGGSTLSQLGAQFRGAR